MGAWIEIIIYPSVFKISLVAPLVGAWIEIYKWVPDELKEEVAPLVGAWIEIMYDLNSSGI